MAYLTMEQLAATDHTVTLTKPKKAGEDVKEKGPYVSPFAAGQTLPVLITEQALKVSRNGFLQLELARSIIKDDGREVKAGRIWINLPVFSAEMAANMDNGTMQEKIDSFGKKLHGVLRAALPEQFAVFKEIDKSEKQWKYITHDGQVLTSDEKDARAEQIGAEIIEAAKKLATGELSLKGSRMYMNEVVKGDNTFVNCYSELPNS